HLGAQLQSISLPPTRATGRPPDWPLGLALSPGSYLGATSLALAFGGLFHRRRRSLAIAFAVYGLAWYVLSLKAFAEWAASHIRSWPLVGFYLHDSGRARYALVFALPILAGLGVQAWV